MEISFTMESVFVFVSVSVPDKLPHKQIELFFASNFRSIGQMLIKLTKVKFTRI